MGWILTLCLPNSLSMKEIIGSIFLNATMATITKIITAQNLITNSMSVSISSAISFISSFNYYVITSKAFSLNLVLAGPNPTFYPSISNTQYWFFMAASPNTICLSKLLYKFIIHSYFLLSPFLNINYN